VHHVAETLVALGGAFLSCGLLAPAGAPIGVPTIPLFVSAGVVLGPDTPALGLVTDPTSASRRARRAGKRRHRSPGREGTCRSPT
jgi:monovalent cation:H+ antiporter-2, CPA2 family